MKLLLLTPILLVSLTFSAFSAESTVKKVEQDVAQTAEKTEATVKKGAKRTGEAVESAAKKTGDAVKTGAEATEGAAKKVARTTKKAADDVANSELFQKLEKELGKPFTPEQKAKYADAWNDATAKVRATEKEFAEKVSEITGLGKRKSKAVVSEQGL